MRTSSKFAENVNDEIAALVTNLNNLIKNPLNRPILEAAQGNEAFKIIYNI